MVGMQAKPSFRHEIDHKPDAGFFKFYATVLGLDTLIGPTPTFFRVCGVSYDAKCSYRFDFPSLVNWLCSAGLNHVYVGFAIDHLHKALSEFVSSPVVRDRSLYMTCNVTEDDLLDESLISAPLPTEEASHVKSFRTEEPIHQSSLDEISNNMRDLSLSWGNEFDDDRYVDMKDYLLDEYLISTPLPTEEASHVKNFRTEESIHQSSFDEISNNMPDLNLFWEYEFDDDRYVDMKDYLLDEYLISTPLPTEEASHVKNFRTEESIHQSSFDEISNNMPDLNLSWGYEFDDDRYVDMNNYYAEDDLLDESLTNASLPSLTGEDL